ncbi:MAG: carboxypeptidase-like regulatory domain-containing protein [Acidobacteriota bacterium]
MRLPKILCLVLLVPCLALGAPALADGGAADPAASGTPVTEPPAGPAAPTLDAAAAGALRDSPLALDRLRGRVEGAMDGRLSTGELQELEGYLAASEKLHHQLEAPVLTQRQLARWRAQVRRMWAAAEAPAAVKTGPPSFAPPPQADDLPPAPRPAPKTEPVALQGADRCLDAPLVDLGTYLGTTVGSTQDGSSSCVQLGAAGDVWYRVESPASAQLFADTSGSALDTVLSIYGRCPVDPFDTSFELTCDDNGGPGQTSALSVGTPLPAGEVFVRISGTLTDQGSYQLTLAEGGRLEGRLLSEGGEPIANADVRLQGADNFSVDVVFTGGDGRFVFTDLQAQDYFLSVAGAGEYLPEVYDDIPCPVDFDCPVLQGRPITVALGETTVVPDIRLALGGAVTGRVVERQTGEPIGIAQVALEVADGSGSVAADFTDLDGHYRLDGLQPGTYFAWASVFGPYVEQAFDGIDCVDIPCPPADATPIVIERGRTLTNIDFALGRQGILLGTVRDTAGNPLAGQLVTLYTEDLQPIRQVFSNPDGSYSLGNTPAGRYYAVAGDSVFSQTFVPELFPNIPCTATVFGECDFQYGQLLEVELEQTLEAIDFTLSRGASLSGRVTVLDGDGTSAPAGVRLLTEDGQGVAELSVEVDGRFEFTGQTGGAYKLEAFGPFNRELYSVVYPDEVCLPLCDLDRGETVTVAFEQSRSGLDIALPEASSISGRVTSAADGAPVPGILVRTTAADGRRSGFTEGDGSYRISGLLPGEVELSVSGVDGFLDASRTLVVGFSQRVMDQDFALDRGASVSGQVRMRDGGEVDSGTSIRILDESLAPVQVGVVPVGTSPNYTITGLRPGSYFVFLVPGFNSEAQAINQLWPASPCFDGFIDETCRAAAQRVEVPSASAAVTGIDFVVDRFGDVGGTVRSAVTGLAGLDTSAEIEMWTSAGFVRSVAFVGFDGSFAFGSVPPGDYFFVVRPSLDTLGYTDLVFGGGPCIDQGCDPLSGSPVRVELDQSVRVDVAVPRGGGVGGRIRDRQGLSIADGSVAVELYDAANRRVAIAQIEGDRWGLGGVPDGLYRAVARDLFTNRYFDQVQGGENCSGGGCDLSTSPGFVVEGGAFLGGLDFALDLAAEVSGRVSEGSTGLPVVGARVEQWSAGGALLAETLTGPAGTYRLAIGEPSYVTVTSTNFEDKVWPNALCPPGACADVLLTGELVLPQAGFRDGFDFALARDVTCGSATELCTLDGRFRISARWQTGINQGQGGAVPLTAESGYFWFFSPNNVEVVIKTLDACDGFGHFWVFSAGLTDVGVEITVVDSVTGDSRVYENREGDLFVPRFDTTAFATCSADPLPSVAPRSGARTPAAASPVPAPAAPSGVSSWIPVGFGEVSRAEKTCTPSSTAGCLTNLRFRVEGTYTLNGVTRTASVVPLTADTAFLWFFGPDNVEVVLKVLDACNGFDNFWVFATGLTDVGVDLRVTDTETGAVWTYSNDEGSSFAPVADTSAFECTDP